MKTYPLALLVFCFAAALPAQTPAPAVDIGRTPDELDRLLAPIALYPDALVALILPAATDPTDIVLASRYLAANGPAANVDGQPWDESVRALAHYPDVVQWMDTNLEWTQTLGAAFMQQPADVMKAIQRLRAKARAAGALIDTPQQQVVMEDDAICIEPAQPDVIYVPSYDPDLVFWGQEPLLGRPYLTFGLGYSIGVWLDFDCDWRHHNVWVRQHPRDWDRRHEPVRPPTFWRPDNDGHAWRPSPDRPRFFPPTRPDQRHDAIPRPRPMPEGTVDRPHPTFNPEPNSRRPGENDRAPGQPANRPSPSQVNAPPSAQRPVPPPAPPGRLRREGDDHGGPDRGGPQRPVQSAPAPSQMNAPPPGQRSVPPPAPPGGLRREGEDRGGPDRQGPQRQAPSAPPPPAVRPSAPPPPPPPPPAASQGKNAPSTNGNDRDRD